MTIAQIRTRVRKMLQETSARFWTDDEIDEHTVAGIKSLWREINNLNEDYFFQTASVTQAANATTISNMPSAGVSRILGLAPTTQSDYPELNYFPRKYMHPDFVGARAAAAVDPTNGGKCYYALTGAGAPASAGPTIHVAPAFTASVALTLVYVPTLQTTDLEAADENPLPGELDDALYAWDVAHCLAKEREDGQPDPIWLAKFKTEKEAALVFLDPRQVDEPKVAEEMFGELYE